MRADKSVATSFCKLQSFYKLQSGCAVGTAECDCRAVEVSRAVRVASYSGRRLAASNTNTKTQYTEHGPRSVAVLAEHPYPSAQPFPFYLTQTTLNCCRSVGDAQLVYSASMCPLTIYPCLPVTILNWTPCCLLTSTLSAISTSLRRADRVDRRLRPTFLLCDNRSIGLCGCLPLLASVFV